MPCKEMKENGIAFVGSKARNERVTHSLNCVFVLDPHVASHSCFLEWRGLKKKKKKKKKKETSRETKGLFVRERNKLQERPVSGIKSNQTFGSHNRL